MDDIESLETLQSFLGQRGDEGHVRSWSLWFLKGKVLRPELLGPEGFIPAGLFEYVAASWEGIEKHLCEPREGVEGSTIFQVVNLDVRDDTAESLIINAVRFQSIPEPDAMLAFSSSPERIAEARASFGPDSKLMISESQALFLIDTSTIKP